MITVFMQIRMNVENGDIIKKNIISIGNGNEKWNKNKTILS